MKLNTFIKHSFIYLTISLFLFSCKGKKDVDDEVIYLNVYNWQDYIYQYDPSDKDSEKDLLEQFNDYLDDPEVRKQYGLNKKVQVIYDMFDTPETMYNELKLNKSNYDIMCPSDYMIQKLALNLDGLDSTRIQKIDFSRVPNYQKYVSKFLTSTLENNLIDENDPSKGNLNDYTLGYMWGTLGLIYNPSNPYLVSKGYSKEKVIEDFSKPSAWNLLWENYDYTAIASIKDSIRDTYAFGIMHVYNDEFKKLQEDYEANIITLETYKKSINKIFNRSDNETIKKVEKALIEIKDKIYGFEVDTGKTDIVTGKVGINLAWSGDAVYSMNEAEKYGQEFYYALPSYGANIWFDGWCISEHCQGDKLSAAYAFLDFLSIPKNAALNMDYIGYTPFIAGDEVLEQVHEWYDASEEEQGNTVDYDLTYFFEGTLEKEDSDPVIKASYSQTKRQLHAQYPEKDEVNHLCIMKDFGKANDSIVTMWENVKVNPLPIWVKVVVLTTLISFISYLGSYKLIRKYKLNKRKKLREK